MVRFDNVAKCYSCDWEGDEEDMIVEPASLLFYDILLRDSMKGTEVTRSNLLCPKCRTMVRSCRLIDGMAFDR